MLELIFSCGALLIFHAYIGYPLSLFILGQFIKKDVKKSVVFPHTTIIIAVYNEEKRIAEKLDNVLSLVFPKEKLQIIVASDGSYDNTDNVIKSYESKGIELLVMPNHRGKNKAQSKALECAHGEIIVFTDAAALLDEDALEKVISNFSDPKIGCVSSEDRLIGQKYGLPGENYYLQYEMLLRMLESRIHSIVGASGSFFAARREVCRDLDKDPYTLADFRVVLNSVKMGLRAVADPQVIGHYRGLVDEKREFGRKLRTVLRGITEFFANIEFLNVIRYGLFSYEYLCHKLLRWLVPFFLLTVFFTNFILVTKSSIFGILFFGQVMFYSMGLLGLTAHKLGIYLPFKIPAYFILTNTAIFVAWLRYVKGDRIDRWEPSRR